MIASNTSVLVSGTPLSWTTVRFDSNDVHFSTFNKEGTTSRISIVTHHFEVKSSICWSVKGVLKHVTCDFIDNVVSSVENLILEVRFITVLSDWS